MNLNKFVKPKDCEIKYQSYLFLLQNFDESCLKVTRHSYGSKDFDNMYSIGYQIFGEKFVIPLYFVIRQFYGCINDDKVDVFDKKYLSVCSGNVFNEFKKSVEIIIEKISEIRGKEYEIKGDYLKIKVGQGVEDMPVNKLLKINWAVVEYSLISENKNSLFVFSYLNECFWEVNAANGANEMSETSIKDDLKIIESEK